MSKEYADITDRVIEILNAYKSGSLSADLSKDVVSVKKGQYVPQASAAKPVVFVRYERSGLILDLAGGQSRQERVLLRISGATTGTTQEAAIDDATNLMNNIEHILQAHSVGDQLFGSAGRLGWRESDSEPEPFSQLDLEPGADVYNAHFTILWSCDPMIGADALTTS